MLRVEFELFFKIWTGSDIKTPGSRSATLVQVLYAPSPEEKEEGMKKFLPMIDTGKLLISFLSCFSIIFLGIVLITDGNSKHIAYV